MPSNISDKTLTLIACSSALGLVLMDVGFVNVSLGAWSFFFEADIVDLQSLVNVYGAAMASCFLIAGALCDHLGAKRVLIIGLVLFGACSTFCSLSGSLDVMMVFRVGQGAGAAFILPSSLALIRIEFNNSTEQINAIGWWGAGGSLAMAIAPLLGGYLVANLGWQSTFITSLAVAFLSLILVIRIEPNCSPKPSFPLDVSSHFYYVTLMGLLATILLSGTSLGQSVQASLTIASCVFGIALIVKLNSPEGSIIPLAIIKSTTLLVSYAVGAIINFCFYGLLFLSSFTVQFTQGLTPLQTGWFLLPGMLVLALGNLMAGKYGSVLGIKPTSIVGGTVAAAGYVFLASISQVNQLLYQVCGIVAVSLGLAIMTPAITSLILSVAKASDVGVASGIYNTCRQLGAVLGVMSCSCALSRLDFEVAVLLIIGVFIMMLVFSLFVLCRILRF